MSDSIILSSPAQSKLVEIVIRRSESFCRQMAGETGKEFPPAIGVKISSDQIAIDVRRKLAAIAGWPGKWSDQIDAIGYSQTWELREGYCGWGCEGFHLDRAEYSIDDVSEAIRGAFASIDERKRREEAEVAEAARKSRVTAEAAAKRAAIATMTDEAVASLPVAI
jgi:hypothetical protein